MDLHLLVNALVQELGVKLKLVQIPREIMEKNRKAPPPFLEVAVLAAEPIYRKTTTKVVTTNKARSEDFSPHSPIVEIKLTQFLPSLAEVPTKELEAIKERAITSGFDRSLFAGTIVLPIMVKWFTRLPVEIYCPKINKIKTTGNRSFFDRF